MWSKLKKMLSRDERSFNDEISALKGQIWYLEHKLQRTRSGRIMEGIMVDINAKRARIASLQERKRLEEQQLKGGN